MAAPLDADRTAALTPSNSPYWPRLEDQKRAEHTGLRFRMLRGTYQDDLELALRAHVPALRRVVWGPQDQTSNVFRSISGDLGPVCYTSEPTVEGKPGSEPLVSREQAGILTACGYWPLMQGVGEDLVGLREVGVRLDYTPEGGLVAEPIPAHRIEVDVSPTAPMEPSRLALLDLRDRPDGGVWWVWEEWDVSDPGAPRYRILSGDRKEDITRLYARQDGQAVDSAALSGEAYPWRWTQGDRARRPFIPVPVYHALRRASFWDPWYGVEAVAGSLTLAVLHTFWVHCIRDGSISTIALTGVTPCGIQITTPSGDENDEAANRVPVSWVPIEAGAFNLFQPMEGCENSTRIDQLKPSADPLQLIQAIQAFEQRVAVYAGVSVSDLVRQSGDPRSGYALSISSEGKRTAARRLEPQLRTGDLRVLEMSAALVNSAGGRPAIPETGYRISYSTLPLQPDELRARGEHAERMMRLGLMSRSDAVRLFHPEWTEGQIASYLAQAASDRALFASSPTPNLT